MKYPKYTDTKDTELSWIGELPVSWDLKRLNYLFTLKKRPVKEGLGVVTAFRDGQVTLRSKRRIDGFTEADKEIGYQTVHAGDLVIHAMDAFAGAIGVSDSEGKCSPVCSVCEPMEGVNSQFYGYVMRHVALSGYITSLAKGIRERSTDFRWSDARLLRLPVPPNQAQIVAFLKRETAKIDKLIAKQQKLIKLLQEKRQAVISQAVTKGLDPNVKMKDSGVEWLGTVPEHWSTRKLCQISISIGDGLHGTPTYDDLGPVFFVNGNNLNGRKVQVSDGTRRVSYLEAASQNGMLKVHAVLLSINGTIGNTAIWDGEQIMLGKSIAFINPIPQLDSRYLSFFLSTSQAKNYFKLSVTGTTISNLGLAAIRSMRVPLPTLLEQRNIVSDLNQRLNKFDDASTRVEQQKSLLLEHRQALITAAVTGKIDVRGLVTDEEVAALDVDPVLETTEEDFESEVAEADYITEEE